MYGCVFCRAPSEALGDVHPFVDFGCRCFGLCPKDSLDQPRFEFRLLFPPLAVTWVQVQNGVASISGTACGARSSRPMFCRPITLVFLCLESVCFLKVVARTVVSFFFMFFATLFLVLLVNTNTRLFALFLRAQREDKFDRKGQGCFQCMTEITTTQTNVFYALFFKSAVL